LQCEGEYNGFIWLNRIQWEASVKTEINKLWGSINAGVFWTSQVKYVSMLEDGQHQ
jgi:hypothetical protein